MGSQWLALGTAAVLGGALWKALLEVTRRPTVEPVDSRAGSP